MAGYPLVLPERAPRFDLDFRMAGGARSTAAVQGTASHPARKKSNARSQEHPRRPCQGKSMEGHPSWVAFFIARRRLGARSAPPAFTPSFSNPFRPSPLEGEGKGEGKPLPASGNGGERGVPSGARHERNASTASLHAGRHIGLIELRYFYDYSLVSIAIFKHLETGLSYCASQRECNHLTCLPTREFRDGKRRSTPAEHNAPPQPRRNPKCQSLPNLRLPPKKSIPSLTRLSIGAIAAGGAHRGGSLLRAVIRREGRTKS